MKTLRLVPLTVIGFLLAFAAPSATSGPEEAKPKSEAPPTKVENKERHAVATYIVAERTGKCPSHLKYGPIFHGTEFGFKAPSASRQAREACVAAHPEHICLVKEARIDNTAVVMKVVSRTTPCYDGITTKKKLGIGFGITADEANAAALKELGHADWGFGIETGKYDEEATLSVVRTPDPPRARDAGKVIESWSCSEKDKVKLDEVLRPKDRKNVGKQANDDKTKIRTFIATRSDGSKIHFNLQDVIDKTFEFEFRGCHDAKQATDCPMPDGGFTPDHVYKPSADSWSHGWNQVICGGVTIDPSWTERQIKKLKDSLPALNDLLCTDDCDAPKPLKTPKTPRTDSGSRG